MTVLRRFASYYTRSSLPFLSGLAYGVFVANSAYPLWLEILVGLALVVLGPFVIQLVLTLIVDALRGVDDEPRPAIRPPPRPLEPGTFLPRLTRDR